MDRDHELSAVLADDTRYSIYRAVAEHPGADVTVVDVAEQFGLHPNVARMHLSKLEQAGFLVTDFRRTSGGGRPAKLYRLSEMVVTFGFPPRRYELLSAPRPRALAAGGTRDDAMRVCREAGAAEGRRGRSPATAAAARPRRGGRPRRADHRGAGPPARGRLAGRLSSASSSTTAASASSPAPTPISCAPCTAPSSRASSRWSPPAWAASRSIRATVASAAAASAARCCARSLRA